MPEQTSPEARRWRLQGLIVDGPSLQIHQGDKLLSAEPTQVASLLTLIEAWPEIVDKNTLIDRVWGQRIVSDSAVHKTISLLRQQLREAGADDLIETRHRLGYRLTQPPQALDQQAPTTQTPSRPRSRKPQWPRFAPAWLWGLPVLVLIGLIAWYWLIEAPTSEEAGAVEDKPPAVVDHSAALSGRDIDTLIELARSSMPDDLAFADQALTIARRQLDGSTSKSSRAMLEKYTGILHFYRAEHQRAIDHWNLALAGFERTGNRAEIANVLTNLGASHEVRDAPPEQVAVYYQRALSLRRELGDPAGLARTLNNQATLWIAHGRIEPARSAIIELTEVAEASGDIEWQLRANLLAGDLDALQAGVDAAPAFMAAYELAIRHGRVGDAAIAAQRLARTYGQQGDWILQREWLESARRHVVNAGRDAQLPIIGYALGINHERRGESSEARRAYRAVLDQLPENESIHLAVDAQVALARLDFQDGRTGSARQRLDNALRTARVHDHDLAEASALLARGFMDLSEPDGAAAAFQSVAAIRDRLGESPPFGIQRHLLRLEALALIASGRIDEARGVAARLSDLARSRQHQTAEQDSRLIDAIALFYDGRFDEGWRAHQMAQGQSLVPLPSPQDIRPAVPSDAANKTERTGLSPWLSVLLIALAFVSGWVFSSRLRSDP